MSDFSFKSGTCAAMKFDMAFSVRTDYDLAKGAGGNCRWLVPTYGGVPLTNSALWRAPGGTNPQPAGWTYISADLTGVRGGDFLYIVNR